MQRQTFRFVLPLLFITLILGSHIATQANDVATQANDVSRQFHLANGLSIHKIATDTEVPDCTCITIDEHDNIFAAGPNYLRMLTLNSSGNSLDSVTVVSRSIGQAAQGLHVQNGEVHYVADGGIWRFQLGPDNTDLNSPRRKLLTLPTGGEHQAHAIRRAANNNWYLIVGNDCDSMFKLQNTSSPVIPNPRAGMIWRFSDDWQKREVVAHGLRNAYDFDFNEQGGFVTYDSDGERDVSLPWYRPTRVFHIKKGDDAGWVTRSWKRANHDPTMPRVLAELGRGSPTGVKRASKSSLPERFHTGTFVLDWTFGRIIFVTDQGKTEIVVQPNNYSGFAVTDIETLSDGRLIVSVGGRGTSGGIYLIDSSQEETSPETSTSTPAQTDSPSETNSTISLTSASKLKPHIVKLREQTDRHVKGDLAELAINTLEADESSEQDWIEAIALLIESVGGLGAGDPKDPRGKTQAAAVFDGYRCSIRPQLHASLIERATNVLTQSIEPNRKNRNLYDDIVRAIAVLEPDCPETLACLVNEMQNATDPIRKTHLLIAIARIPTKRNDDQTDQIATEMIELVRGIYAGGFQTDRHWPVRLAELFDALQYRDSLLPSRLVAAEQFGHPADLAWMDKMDPENLERARQRLLSSKTLRNNPKIAAFISRGSDAVPRPIIRHWLDQSETREAGLIALASHARVSDAEELLSEAWSSNSEIRQLVRSAIEKLDLVLPPRPNQSPSTKVWEDRAENILQLSPDVDVGSRIYETKQCKKCHAGSRAMGPRLEGVGKRFTSFDLLRAIYDPSHTIPDRYRPRIIMTHDGERIEGIPVYESFDGITLITQDGKTIRVERHQISQSKNSNVSSMPEGLLDGLADQEVCDLVSYLNRL